MLAKYVSCLLKSKGQLTYLASGDHALASARPQGSRLQLVRAANMTAGRAPRRHPRYARRRVRYGAAAGARAGKNEITEAELGLRIAPEETLESFSESDSWRKLPC